MTRQRIGLAFVLAMGMAGTAAAQRSGTPIGTAEPRDSVHAQCLRDKADVQGRINLRRMYVAGYLQSQTYQDDLAELNSYNC